MAEMLRFLTASVVWGCVLPSDQLGVTLTTGPGLRDVVAEVSGAADGQLTFAWLVDGYPVHGFTERVPVHELAPGQTWAVTVSAPGLGSAHDSIIVADPIGSNVVLIVLDDIGVDKLSFYGLNPEAPATPALSALAAEGMVFRQAYATPTCSSTRAALLTGRHGRRTGAGYRIDMSGDDWELSDEALTIPRVLEHAFASPVATAAVGKWHLAGNRAPSVADHALRTGFASFVGSEGYLVEGRGGPVDGYFRWRKNIDGKRAVTDVYNTTDTANDAIDRLRTLPEPFFLWVAFNAAHVPLHVPPADLHSRTLDDDSPAKDKFAAMVEALDHEIGRVLAAMPHDRRMRTTFIVIGDNGTSDEVMDPAFDRRRGKHTLFEGGVRVPLVLVGPSVAPGVSDTPVHAVDVFPTVADLLGVPLSGQLDARSVAGMRLDGRSLLHRSPPGRFIYTENFRPNGPGPFSLDERAVQDASHRLIVRSDGREELYPVPGPGELHEGLDLLDQPGTLGTDLALARAQLRLAMAKFTAELAYEGR